MPYNPEINLETVKSAFFAWRKGLLGSLPAGLVESFLKPLPRLVVEVVDQRLDFIYMVAKEKTIIDTAELSELGLDNNFLRKKLLEHGLSIDELYTEIHLQADQVLSFETSLPAQAEDDVKQVLAYQLDRLTPFSTEQVYYDAIVQGRDELSGKLAIKLQILPKSAVKDLLAGVAKQLGAGISRLALVTAPSRFNFLDSEPPRRKLNRNFALLTSLILILAVAPLVPVLKARSVVVDQYQVLGELKGQVRELVAIRNELQSSLAALGYVIDRREQSPSTVALLEEVSKLVPDHSYLRQLQIRGDRLQIQGEGSEAVELIEKLEASSFLKEVKFSSALTHDARAGVDRFQIEATLEIEP